MFIPKGGRPACGKTDVQGHYTLLSYAAGDGAIAGEHTVCIAKNIPDPKDHNKQPYHLSTIALLPAKYSTPLKSPLRQRLRRKGPTIFRSILSD